MRWPDRCVCFGFDGRARSVPASLNVSSCWTILQGVVGLLNKMTYGTKSPKHPAGPPMTLGNGRELRVLSAFPCGMSIPV
jgi:hypothetical protein